VTRTWTETLYDAYGQQFSADRVLYEAKTDHQHLLIFQNAIFGRVMVLDGIVQTTEKDEFIYHEMLTHVPILAHGNVKRVLIIGGGDGAMLREVCKYRSVENITQVEIDQLVVDTAREFLPAHNQGAYDDPRLNLVISDGLDYVSNSNDKFDVIITDSTDPIGPGEVLFTSRFYKGCKRCLNDSGILVTQNGVPFFQIDVLVNTAQKLAPLFNHVSFYGAAVPTYVGGIMTFGWATNKEGLQSTPLEVLQERYGSEALKTSYYTPEIHQAAFVLPQYILDALDVVKD